MTSTSHRFIWLLIGTLMLLGPACRTLNDFGPSPSATVAPTESAGAPAATAAVRPTNEPAVTLIPTETAIANTEVPSIVATESISDDLDSRPGNTELRIVYHVHGQGLFRWQRGELEGTLIAPVAEIGHLALSSNGRFAAYTVPIGFTASELWLVDLSTLNQRLLLDEARLRALAPDAFALHYAQLAWIPGRDTLAFGLSETFEDGPGLNLHGDLNYFHVDDDRLQTIFSQGEAGNFTFSPDGQHMAITTPTTAHLYRPDGDLVMANVISFEFVLTYSEYAFVPVPIWAADSASFLIALPSWNALEEDADPASIWQVSTGGVADHILDFYPGFGFAFTGPDFIAPNLQQIVYTRPVGEPADNVQEVVLHNLLTGAQQVLDSGNFQIERWSPDSLWFTYQEYGESEQLHLFNIESGESENSDSRILNFRWIDALWAIFDELVAERWELQLVSFDGTSILLSDSERPHHFEFAGR